MSEKDLVRLQKVIARSGIASRREAERLIASGLVSVNGALVDQLGARVSSDDRILVRGKEILPAALTYLMVNKPRGFVCSNDQHSKFPSFLDLLPQDRRSVHHVGRLDVASDGLLLATSDGAFTQVVTHPSFEVPKFYEVLVRGAVNGEVVRDCMKGVIVDGEQLRFQDLRSEASYNGLTKLHVRLIGGKNREIRRLLNVFELGVSRLTRVSVGPVKLGGLKSGAWRELKRREIESLKAFREVSN